MNRQRLLLIAVIAALVAPPALAQSRGDVIVPPPTKPDSSVVTPPAADADPGIEKGKPPEQSQLPDEKKEPRRGDAALPGKDKDR